MKSVFPLSLLLALAACGSDPQAAQIEKGKMIFERICSSCHTLGTEIRVGPPLKGVIGRKIASVPGFDYSDDMKKDHGSWTPEKLKSYVMGPMQMYPDGRMVIEPLNAEDAAAVAAFLQHQ